MKKNFIKNKKIIILSGGSGGHIFPGICIAKGLIKKGWKIHWVGTSHRIESKLVPQYNIKVDFIYILPIKKIRIKNILILLTHILFSFYRVYNLIKKTKPDMVLGMGSYISSPGILAAWICKIPIILHEQNAIPGITNYWFSKISCKVLQAFPGAFPNAEIVGNPVRKSILDIPLPKKRLIGRTGPLRILVLGGSQGSTFLNKIVPNSILSLKKKVTIWHQTGKGFSKKVTNLYSKIGVKYKVDEFIYNISKAYIWADLVISCSGALTVSEIAAVGLPAIFIPFQHRNQHQYWNAILLKKIGAAKIIKQKNFTEKKLIKILYSLNRKVLIEMAKKAKKISFRNSTNRIINIINNYYNFINKIKN